MGSRFPSQSKRRCARFAAMPYLDSQKRISRDSSRSLLRDHYKAQFKSSGVKPLQLACDEYFCICSEDERTLNIEPIPYNIAYLWEWFVELSGGRQYGMDGGMPFSWSDIEAWTRLSGNNPTSEDIKLLKQLDLLAIKNRK